MLSKNKNQTIGYPSLHCLILDSTDLAAADVFSTQRPVLRHAECHLQPCQHCGGLPPLQRDVLRLLKQSQLIRVGRLR